MRSFLRIRVLTTAACLLLADAANGAQGQSGNGPGGKSARKVGTGNEVDSFAQARGDGPFVVDVGDLALPAGAKLSGMVDPHLTPRAADIVHPYTYPGAITRADIRMDIVQNRTGNAAELVAQAHEQGLKIMMTFIGTPTTNLPPGVSPSDPEAWKYAPGDAVTWTADLIGLLKDIIDETEGELPDYIKIWNEPDQEYTYLGTSDAFLEFFRVAMQELELAFATDEVLQQHSAYIGGPGMADWDSAMDGTIPLLYRILDDAAFYGYRLDYLCWHEYFIQKPANTMRFYQPVQLLNDRAASLNLPPLQWIVDEWNIYPDVVDNPNAFELDGHRAAATATIFIASAAQTAVDGIMVFLLQDVDPFGQIKDLDGAGNGLMSRRGVRKPVFRIIELLRPMLDQMTVSVAYPPNEWAAGVYATRSSNRIRFLVANDPVRSDWVWAEQARYRGGEPGVWWNVLNFAAEYFHVALENVTPAQIIAAGLLMDPPVVVTEDEANHIVAMIPIVSEAEDLWWDGVETPRPEHYRTVEIQLEGVLRPSVQVKYPVYQFTQTVNNPSYWRENLLPVINEIEIDARHEAYLASAAQMQVLDPDDTLKPFDPELIPTNPIDFAAMMGIDDDPLDPLDDEHPTIVYTEIYVPTIEDQRLAQEAWVNAQPDALLFESVAAEAGITYDQATGILHVTLAPATSVAFDITFLDQP